MCLTGCCEDPPNNMNSWTSAQPTNGFNGGMNSTTVISNEPGSLPMGGGMMSSTSHYPSYGMQGSGFGGGLATSVESQPSFGTNMQAMHGSGFGGGLATSVEAQPSFGSNMQSNVETFNGGGGGMSTTVHTQNI